MISKISGKIYGKHSDHIEIEIGHGITLVVYMPPSNISTLIDEDRIEEVFTSLQLRQDSITIFGFLDLQDRITFEKLITISGVGPRLAVAILSAMNSSEIFQAIETENSHLMTQVPGVGKRTADRMILELKGKLQAPQNTILTFESNNEIVESLTALGYSTNEAKSAASKIPTGQNLSLEDRIRIALQNISSND
ncbi:MAG: Holliday junction branch migration protein RuvA [Dehalococcoidia bacterium]|tara:strand:+ start:3153 stop:3734 length:582 start_codon:yes stop_codon:yes gene_type:complete